MLISKIKELRGTQVILKSSGPCDNDVFRLTIIPPSEGEGMLVFMMATDGSYKVWKDPVRLPEDYRIDKTKFIKELVRLDILSVIGTDRWILK